MYIYKYIVFLFLHVGYLICVALSGDLANHLTSSILDAKTFGLMLRSNQIS